MWYIRTHHRVKDKKKKMKKMKKLEETSDLTQEKKDKDRKDSQRKQPDATEDKQDMTRYRACHATTAQNRSPYSTPTRVEKNAERPARTEARTPNVCTLITPRRDEEKLFV
jgi:hypothetical protein